MTKKRGRGIYGGIPGIEEGDFIVWLDHRGRFRVDLVSTSGGHAITLGKTAGETTLQDATTLAAKESWRRGNHHGVVFVQSDDSYHQIGNVVDGKYRKSG